MDQYSQYLMWMKSKHNLNSHFQEQASIWPPRSYSCSFCKRGFRSAQALGGHMNIHRRDRARLKQSALIHLHTTKLLHHQKNHHNQLPCKSLEYSNPDPNSNPSFAAVPLEKNPLIFLSRDDCVETSLSVGLNLGSGGDEAVSCKRYKSSPAVPSFPFFLINSSMEDLDLELRLGDPPKVK